jgi:TM2 domain-containing membrane protein YozV
MLPEFADVAATAPAPAAAPAAQPAAYAVPTTPVMPGAVAAPGAKDRTTAGILAILLGSFGVHHFYLGNTTIGIIYVVLACLGISPLLGLVDGIVYLTKPEDQFQRNYRNWFCSGV